MKIIELPEKLEVVWCEDVRAIWDKWISYRVTLQEFKQAIMLKGVPFAKANRAQAWIADASTAKGVFDQSIQDYIASDVFKTFAAIGIKYFISVQPKSAVAKLGVMRYQTQVGPNGIQLVEVATIEGAFAFLREQGKAVG
jgi:hypothetical protein